MQFCPKHSVFDRFEEEADGTKTPIGWVEPSMISTQNYVDPNTGRAVSMHVLSCGDNVTMPDDSVVFYNCKYTADQMRENLAASLISYGQTDEAEVAPEPAPEPELPAGLVTPPVVEPAPVEAAGDVPVGGV